MNTKRSFLDELNVGRQRRSGPAIDEINRTLDLLEQRLGRGLDLRDEEDEEGDVARRIQRISDEIATRQPRGEPAEPRTVERRERRAEELKTLREDMRAVVHAGLRREFDTLRDELARIMEAVPRTPATAGLNVELERLSEAIAQLAERSEDKSTKVLRLELEEVKTSLAKLAREDTVRALDKRWNALEERLGGPAIEALARRLDAISTAVERLPESLSLDTLEERVRALAGSLEQFAGQREAGQPDLQTMIEERLDEISRAITASAALAHSPQFDPKLLERIEARIASLANQINELADDRPGAGIVDSLEALSQRVDEIASRLDAPEQAVERLTAQVAEISRKLDNAPATLETDQLFQGLEDRFSRFSDHMAQRQEDASQDFFAEMEQRLQALSERLDREAMAAMEGRIDELAARIEEAREGASDGADLKALESRLEAIAARLEKAPTGVEAEVIHRLEAQVAELAAGMARPAGATAGSEAVDARLEGIERAIAESRAALTDVAREAAEQAVQAMAGVRGQDDPLKQDLQALEALTRKSEERNAKTFEAIHDTLLKIVERLGALEAGESKIAVAEAPSLDPAASEEEEEASPAYSDMPRTPAEAAAEAAKAALREDADEKESGGERRTMLGGLSRAFSARRETPSAEDTGRREPTLAETQVEADEAEIDLERINEPLEPGSGAPDLNAIMRRVRDERDREATDTAKADFIAAARRAAQAAAAEAEFLKQGRADPADKRGRFSLGGLLRRRKTSLLVVAGAAALLGGGAYLASTMLPEGGWRQLVTISIEPAEEAAAEEAADEAATGDQAAEAAAPAGEAFEADTTAAGHADLPAEPLQAPAAGTAPLHTGAVAPWQDPDLAAAQRLSAEADLPAVEPAPLRAVPEPPLDAGTVALREAAMEGDAAALYEIGNRYAAGRGGLQADAAEAARWYEYAAERGLAPAQYRLGNLYEKGTGVKRDADKAKMWYERAAEQGNASAMHNLGVLLAMGATDRADNEAAARWFLEAAELGVVDSQFNLGILSVRGVGVPRDLTESYKWFDIVARTGDEDAAAKRDEIAEALSPEELATAEGKARLWRPREPDPTANVVDVRPEWTEDDIVTGGIGESEMRQAISNVQLILNGNGFDAGPVDGVMGERTRAAIRAFQKQNGLPETGEIDEALVHALLERAQDGQS